MLDTQYIDVANLRSIVGRKRVTMADAISLAEARVYHQHGDDVLIEDVEAKRLRNSDAWAVTFTFTPVEEDPTHPVVVRGGHSLYCTTCDRDVARLATGTTRIRADKRHEREVLALIRPIGPIVWDLIG